MHHFWNRSLVRSVDSARVLLDLCAGTGEIAFTFLKGDVEKRAYLLDFCPEMLAIAREKGKLYALQEPQYLLSNAERLPLPDKTVEAVTLAYGIRNILDRKAALAESYRVLQPGGKIAILELTRPRAWLRPLHALYLRVVLPLVGRLATGEKEAYAYLAESIEKFLALQELESLLKEVGFVGVESLPLCGGIATRFMGHKS